MKKKIIGFFVVALIFLVVLFAARKPIMRSLSSFLIYENDFTYVENAFVLSGGAFDRGTKAAKLYKEGKVGHYYCTGENQSPALKAFGTDVLESELTEMQMMKMGVPDSAITLFKVGTSTLEESEAILNFAIEFGLKEVVIISSKFHTRRVKQVFKKKFAKLGVEVFIQGAPSSAYNEQAWWESEYGLIALNNEYIKQLYYLVKF